MGNRGVGGGWKQELGAALEEKADPAKIARRLERVRAVESLQADLAPGVAQAMRGHGLYALKSTHITWARRLSNYDSVRSQVGHAGQDVEERCLFRRRRMRRRGST